MRRGILLDPITGKPAWDDRRLERMAEGGVPAHVLENLARARADSEAERMAALNGGLVRGARASRQGWQELIYCPIADGTAVTASSETIMVPDYTLPANYMTVGKALRYTVFFRHSSAITTPGTFTLRLRWGGVAGVALAASGAFAPDPTAAATNLSMMVQYWLVCRTDGATGTFFTMGNVTWNDFDDATVTTLQGNLNMLMIPTSGAATATVDTTTAKAISPTYQASVTTASMTAHLAFLESLN